MRKQTKIAALVSAAALLAIGASMTSLAATGWVETSEGEYQWLDAYGDPVYDEWKRGTGTSADKWYYLGEDGYMLKDQVFTDTENHTFYVDENGERKTNYWYSLDNEDDVDLNEDGEEESILWMYFQANGRAVKADQGDVCTTAKLKWSGGENIFVFNEDGYMLSGWYKPDKTKTIHKASGTYYGDVIYYLGSENEGWARTGWAKLPVPQDHVCPDSATEHWYYFDLNTAQAYVQEDGEKYINGRWYSFGETGDPAALREGWSAYSGYPKASTATPPVEGAYIYNYVNGSQGYGWVYTSTRYNDDYDCFDKAHAEALNGSHWYYLVTYRDEDANGTGYVVRSIPFNAGTGVQAAKSINGKTYLFEGRTGRMMYGLQEVTWENTAHKYNWYGINMDKGTPFAETAIAELAPGYYYFNNPENAKASNAGQMVTGRVTIYDEENTVTNYYSFAKKNTKYTRYVYVKDWTNKDGDKVTGFISEIEKAKVEDGLTDEILGKLKEAGDSVDGFDYDRFYYTKYQGQAYWNEIADGTLYDWDGKRIQAEDGNSYTLVPGYPYRYLKGSNVYELGSVVDATQSGLSLVVSNNGRVKTSGIVKIDGETYEINSTTLKATLKAN